VAAGLGEDEATRFLTADDFDFMAFNHVLDAGGTWEEGEAELRRTHPHWVEHAAAYRAHFPESLVGEVPGSVAIVRELHDAGVPMIGLTNWPDEFWPHAPRKFEFLGLLDDIVVSGTEGVAKPDAEIFEIAVARAGVPPRPARLRRRQAGQRRRRDRVRPRRDPLHRRGRPAGRAPGARAASLTP